MPFKLPSVSVESPERGILHVLLELLHDLMQSQDKVEQPKSRKALSIDNFFLWDEHNEEKSSFVNFSREEKFSRVFAILDLITTLLEADLAMFIVKFSRHLRTSILNENQRPLICAILWQSYESVIVVNSTIKTIIQVFVNMTALDYPPENLRVISRLLNVVAQVTNLYEYPDETFEYPNYGSLSVDLVRTIQKTIEASSRHSVKLITTVAENLRSPLMKMLLMSQTLEKIRGAAKISLEVPFEILRNKEWEKFKQEVKIERAKQQVPLRYPVLVAKQQPRKVEVSQKDFLNVSRIFAASINDFYQIKASVNGIYKVQKPETISQPPPPLENLRDEPIALRKTDKSFKKLVHIKLTLETCLFYRNEIKHFIILPKLVRKSSERFGEKFDEWMELVKAMEEQ
jgi:hypothetical protein